MLWYILDENKNPVPSTAMRASRWMHGDDENDRSIFEARCRVGLTTVRPGVEVSTVFLGLDHGHDSRKPPVLFETMVFRDGHGCDGDRYTTWADAKAGHDKTVAEVRAEKVEELPAVTPEPRTIIPLELSGREQEFFADLCAYMRGVVYDYEIGKPRANDAIADKLYETLDRYNLSPTQLDGLYDRMHRSGANS
jgi:hypothetical protein